MRYLEWLEKRIRIFCYKGLPVPTDLYIEASNAGLEVDKLEDLYRGENY